MLIFASSAMSNKSTSLSEDAASASSVGTTKFVHDFASLSPVLSSLSPPLDDHQHQQQNNIKKKKRSLPGNPVNLSPEVLADFILQLLTMTYPDAEVVAFSPKTLLATNRFVCEVCNKGFRREQNLQLHRRGHNLPWKLKQRSSKEMMMMKKKKAYVCPEPSCVHHHPCRALGDLTGIKKHFCRKHGDKKWMCNKCSKLYAVQSDWKAHSKTCGTRENTCDSCGTLFFRKSSFITHRAFCEALAEESARVLSAQSNLHHFSLQNHQQPSNHIFTNFTSSWDPPPKNPNPNPNFNKGLMITSNGATSSHISAIVAAAATSAQQPQSTTTTATHDQLSNNIGVGFGFGEVVGHFSPEFLGMSTWKKTDRLTRDFLGLAGGGNGSIHHRHGSVNVSVNVRDVLNFPGGVEFQTYDRLKFAEHDASDTWVGY